MSCLQITLSARHYLQAPSGLFCITFLRMPRGEHLGEFISFKDLHLCSILPPSFSTTLLCFGKPGLCSSSSCRREIATSKSHWHHQGYLKWVFSAAFSDSTAFLYANWCARQKSSWVQMTKTGFQLAWTHVHCKNRWKLIKLMEELQ